MTRDSVSQLIERPRPVSGPPPRCPFDGQVTAGRIGREAEHFQITIGLEKVELHGADYHLGENPTRSDTGCVQS